MLYNDFKGLKLSNLGFGLMRLPTIDKEGNIDEEKAEEMIDYAIKNGINYFDTAWGYHNGTSEIVAGKILSKYDRNSIYIATKFPGYDNSNMTKKAEIFDEQLKRLNTDYFDFYLMHNVCENNFDNYMSDELSIVEYFKKQKDKGRIKHLGFSTHGSIELMEKFIIKY